MENKSAQTLQVGGHRAASQSATATVSKEDLKRLNEKNWSLHPTGYVTRQERIGQKQVTVYLHREVMGLDHGDERVVDHIDGNPLNCCRENLRILEERGHNAQNVRSRRGVSRFRGVHRSGSKWAAAVKANGAAHRRYGFETELEAAIAAEAMREELLPFAQPDPALAAELGRVQEAVAA